MYSHIVLGGTFDHLHAGHRDLLSLAFSESKKVTLGLTKASMNVNKTVTSQILPYRLREQEILAFAQSINRTRDIRIIPIKDMYGSTLTDKTLDAIVVTPHTQAGAGHINQKRQSNGLPELPIVVCPLRLDSHGEILCSSNIRLGMVNRAGLMYQDIFSTDMQISDTARDVFRRPIGKATGAREIRSIKDPCIVIGDVVTQYCMDHGIPFSQAYIDGKSKHAVYSLTLRPEYSLQKTQIQNPAGSITSQAAQKVTETLHEPREIIQIEGEEDLLTVAAVILLPFGTRIIYGYPYAPQSMRMITIDERIKEKFAKLVQN
jgi:pantetheine-phosphate adenylyltransferase